MRGPRTTFGRVIRVVAGVVLACAAACGGEKFGGSKPGSNGEAGSSASTQGGGDAAGSNAGLGSNAGSGGNGGNGGTSASDCACPAGSYCRDGSTDCFDCTELSRLKFQAPERLATLSGGTGSRFPRSGGTGIDLLYQYDGVGLRYTTDSSTSAGSTVMQTQPLDSGPLLLPRLVMGAPGAESTPFDFAFDRAEAMFRQLYFGRWQGGAPIAQPAPEPFSSTDSSNFGFAAAFEATPTRAYWMTDRRQDGFELFTALLFGMSPATAVELRVGSPSCPAAHTELTPWVTPDGTTLLFSHERLDSSCQSSNQGRDIYTALMVPATGQVLPAASDGGPTPSQPLSDVNSAADDSDPSFSADFCDLYFASNRDGQYALYRAHRR